MTKQSKTSNITKHYGKWYIIFGALSIISFFFPMIYFTGEALYTAQLVHQKIAICSTVMAVIIMSIVAAVNKLVLRSRVWIIVIGLWLCLENFLTPIIVIAVTQILDELIFSPLCKYFKERYVINRQIDKREATKST